MIEALVEQIEARFGELERELSDPGVISDRQRFEAATRAYRQLASAHRLALEWRHAANDAAGARELLVEDGADQELRELQSVAEERMGESRKSCAWRWSSPTPTTPRT